MQGYFFANILPKTARKKIALRGTNFEAAALIR
jgi:hypothetical protein